MLRYSLLGYRTVRTCTEHRLVKKEFLQWKRQLRTQSQSYITTDSQLASLSWCQALNWDPRSIFPSLIIFRHLRVCWCGAPSLTKGRVCSFQLLLGIISTVFLGPRPAGLMIIIFLSLTEWEREREENVGGGTERHYIGGGVEKTISSV
jgi:hypothetical protein